MLFGGEYSKKWERSFSFIVDADIICAFLLKISNASLEMLFVGSYTKIF